MNSTTLLVIDIQRGAFDGQRCSPIAEPDRLVDQAVSLVAAARNTGASIVFIQHCDGPDEVFEEGSAQWALHDRLEPQPGDTVLKKYASSAFEGTNLAAALADLNARELVLCGLQSEFCVYNTAKSALGLGYKVVIAQDGHSTWPSGGKTASAISEEINAELEASGAALQSTATLVRALHATRTSAFTQPGRAAGDAHSTSARRRLACFVRYFEEENDDAAQFRARRTNRDSRPRASLYRMQSQYLLGARGSIRHATHRASRPRGMESQRAMCRVRAVWLCPYVYFTGRFQANRGVAR
jgi:nicotinamidase-related amidase